MAWVDELKILKARREERKDEKWFWQQLQQNECVSKNLMIFMWSRDFYYIKT